MHRRFFLSRLTALIASPLALASLAQLLKPKTTRPLEFASTTYDARPWNKHRVTFDCPQYQGLVHWYPSHQGTMR